MLTIIKSIRWQDQINNDDFIFEKRKFCRNSNNWRCIVKHVVQQR
jgi:hypothetical protein